MPVFFICTTQAVVIWKTIFDRGYRYIATERRRRGRRTRTRRRRTRRKVDEDNEPRKRVTETETIILNLIRCILR